MNIVVCLKQTFDTEERLSITDGHISEDGVAFVINPYDEYAVEEAIQLKEAHGGEVTVITIGPERAEQALRTAMAMGADQGVIIDGGSTPKDEHTIAKMLAAVIKERDFDLILAGYMAIDGGSAQVGPRLAEELDLPHISTITKLDIEGSDVWVEKDIEGDVAYLKGTLPLVLTAQQGLNEPRYPSLPGIMQAKKKPLARLTVADLDIASEALTAMTETLHVFPPPEKEAGQILTGELDEQIAALVNGLSNEKKVI